MHKTEHWQSLLNVGTRFLKTTKQSKKCRMEHKQAGPPNLTFEHPARENNVNQSPGNVQ
jgi:hypothetical protein